MHQRVARCSARHQAKSSRRPAEARHRCGWRKVAVRTRRHQIRARYCEGLRRCRADAETVFSAEMNNVILLTNTLFPKIAFAAFLAFSTRILLPINNSAGAARFASVQEKH